MKFYLLILRGPLLRASRRTKPGPLASWFEAREDALLTMRRESQDATLH